MSSFSINPATGALSYINSVLADGNGASKPAAVAATATHAYTADQATATISVYSIDPTAGTLAYLSSVSTGAAGTSTPDALAIDPSGKYLIVADAQNGSGTGQLLTFTIDPASGVPTLVGSPVPTDATPGNSTSAVAIDDPSDFNPSYPFVVASNAFDPTDGLADFRFDPSSGSLTAFTPPYTLTGNQPQWIAISPDGEYVYVSNGLDGSITGYTFLYGPTLTAIAAPYSIGAGAKPGAIWIDPSESYLYVTDYATGAGHSDVVGFAINQDNGTLSLLATSPYGAGSTPSNNTSGPFPISGDASGSFVYVGNTFEGTVSEYTLNLGTGALTLQTSLPYNDLGGPPTTTPAQGIDALVVQ